MKMRLHPRGIAAMALAVCVVGMGAGAHASSPELRQIVPRGARRGTELDVTFRGQRLADAKEVMLYDSDFSVTNVENAGGNDVKVHLKVSPEAAIGEHVMRLRTASGITELRNFYVGALPVVQEQTEFRDPAKPDAKPQKRNSTFESPQKIDLNVTVAGLIENEQADYYVVDCKKGQRLTAEVEGMRLGESFDPCVAILDTSRFEICASDDTALLRQDCIASLIIPSDGAYIIQVRESSWGGSGESFYRMHIGTFPRPRAVYPAGGKIGEELDVRYVGDISGEIIQHIKVPNSPGEVVGLFAEQDGLIAPSPNSFRASLLPNVLEAEPNDEFTTAGPAVEGPVAFNGIIEKDGDVDFFKFKAKKGDALHINVYARRVRSPLDSVLVIYDPKGKEIAANDDSGSPDSYLRFQVPEDGEYGLSVRDQLKRGGPDFVYRVEIAPVLPQLLLTLPNFSPAGQPSQERQTIVVPRGNRYGTLIRATRGDFGEELVLSMDGLPQGVTVHAENVPSGQDVVPVVFDATADAPVGGALCSVGAKPVGDKPEVRTRFVQDVELVFGYPNNTSYYSTPVKRLAVAVVDELPYAISIVKPKVPLLQNGALELKIKAERKGDFKGPINLKMLWDPPGVGSGQVTIPPDKSEFVFPLNANGNAPTKQHRIAVLGQADVNGPAWVSTPLTEIDVAPMLVGMQIQKTNIEQGKAGKVLVKIEQKTPFEGKAKCELMGLPNAVTAAAVEFGKDATEITFDVSTDPKSPAGVHSNLQCRITLEKDGESMIQSAGGGGVLRIDAPPKVEKTPEETKSQGNVK